MRHIVLCTLVDQALYGQKQVLVEGNGQGICKHSKRPTPTLGNPSTGYPRDVSKERGTSQGYVRRVGTTSQEVQGYQDHIHVYTCTSTCSSLGTSWDIVRTNGQYRSCHGSPRHLDPPSHNLTPPWERWMWLYTKGVSYVPIFNFCFLCAMFLSEYVHKRSQLKLKELWFNDLFMYK